MARLVDKTITSGGKHVFYGMSYPLDNPITLIGSAVREKDKNIPLTLAGISRIHAYLIDHQGDFYLGDTSSTEKSTYHLIKKFIGYKTPIYLDSSFKSPSFRELLKNNSFHLEEELASIQREKFDKEGLQ